MEQYVSAFRDSKRHYLLLDALRGVAALIVVWYHCYEGFAKDIVSQSCNHGYLAVDFFFLLSGFVIGYAYDDRLSEGRMSPWQFIKRRLVRLHPMVVMGAVIGAISFVIGGFHSWSGEHIGLSLVMLALLANMLMIPMAPGMAADVRGNGEMFPLNGPNWSLFFEYLGNIAYVLVLRRLKTGVLALVTVLLGVILGSIVLTSGYLGIGWTLPDFISGMVRMLFPYCLGLLLSRLYRKRSEKGFIMPEWARRHAFAICAVLLLVLLPMPFVGSADAVYTNGIYVMVVILLCFPAVLWLAAEGSERQFGGWSLKAARLLGDLSYPLYAVHYPVMYLFYSFIGFPDVQCTMGDVWYVAAGAVVLSVCLAYAALRLYDAPVRRWLGSRA